MSYGNKKSQDWILNEQEGINQIKAAFAAGINVLSILAVSTYNV
jgi:hypothetical protein